MTTTILVTGATGTIGREIVAALATQPDARVIAGSRDPAAAVAQFHALDTVRTIELDLARPDTFASALAGIDKLAIVNALSPDMGPHVRDLVDAARRARVRHVVRASLLGADEPAPITEARWHAEADRALAAGDLPFTILRPNQYLQNFVRFGNAVSVRDHGMLHVPLGDARVSNIDTRDIGAVAARVLLAPGAEHHGRSYVLTGAAAMTMADVAGAIGDALGRPVRYAAVDPATYRAGMLGAGIPELIADAILEWFAYCRAGRAERVVDDTARLLGRPPIELAAFARDHVRHFR